MDENVKFNYRAAAAGEIDAFTATLIYWGLGCPNGQTEKQFMEWIMETFQKATGIPPAGLAVQNEDGTLEAIAADLTSAAVDIV